MAPACATACFTGITVAGNTATLVQSILDLVDRFKAMLRSKAEEIVVDCSECGVPLTKKDLNSDDKVEEIKAELQIVLKEAMDKQREKDRAATNARLKTMILKECPFKGCDEAFLSRRELKFHSKNCHWARDINHLKME
ncbi:uncharacterized protein [Triticum aestivum]|nr:uncharacterized protein LOC123094087 isoform X1 [Triticum aestivum]